MIHRLWRRCALVAVSLVITLLLNWLSPAYAGFFDQIHLPGSLGGAVKDKLTQETYRQVGEQLGLSDPLILNQKHAFRKIDDIADFHPVHHVFTSVQQIFEPLGVGDHSFDVWGFCAEWSIHAPSHGVGYKLGPTEGPMADVISALLLRGSLLNVNPYDVQSVAWNIEAGAPIQEWNDRNKALADQLIPDYKDRLHGDLLKRYKDEYARIHSGVSGIPGVDKLPPSLDAVVSKLGPVGQFILSVEKAREVLKDRTIANERLPEHLYQATGPQDGLPYVLPQGSFKPGESEWNEVQPGVYARLVIDKGNLAKNRLDVRITPEALKATKEESLPLASKSERKGETLAEPSGLNAMNILYGKSAAGVTADTLPTAQNLQGVQGYSLGTAAQALMLAFSIDAEAAENVTPKDRAGCIMDVMKKGWKGKTNSLQLRHDLIQGLLDAMKTEGITNIQEQAYVLATADWETGGFFRLTENNTEANLNDKYGPDSDEADSLGNTQPGDGYRYRGRGLVHVTGRKHYAEWSDRLKQDFVNNPNLMTDSAIATKVAASGMKNGYFTGSKEKLSKYFENGASDYFNARSIINGDKNNYPEDGEPTLIGQLIANQAMKIESALKKCGK